MLTHSLIIESLLCKISPEVKGNRHLIEKNPYGEIVNVLAGRVSIIEVNKFIMHYKGVDGKSIKDLIAENYDIDLFVSDLEEIIKEL